MAGALPNEAPRRRRWCGCLLGVLAELLVVLGVTLLGVLFGQAYWERQARKQREREQRDYDGDA